MGMGHHRAAMLGCGIALAAIAVPLAAQDMVVPDAAERAALAEGEETTSAPPQPTRVLSQRDAARLRALKGITLQWISWDKRGRVDVSVDAAGVWRLIGEQSGPDAASVAVEGVITEIGPDYFELEGAVTILNTPDEGRTCEGDGTWRFAVTQGRKYYRLRRFEWCDDLTDYIDFYF